SRSGSDLVAGADQVEQPFFFEQVLEKEVAPLGRRLRPGHFRTAGNGVAPDARAVPALPSEALILERGAFRLWADQRRIARTVGLTEAVATGNQRDGLFVVHRHAEER